MRFSFKSSISRAMSLLALLGLGFVQVGCAHPVVVEPSVSVSSRIGHFPVYAQVGVPAPMVVMPQAPVFYAPPPPRVIYAPQIYSPYGWGNDHGRRHWGHERRHFKHDNGGRDGWGHRGDGRR
jgi:hypothetical protein